MLKRLIDIGFSFLGLIILLPIFLVVALAILLQDGKPVFFRQKRVGLNGQDFSILKFRTMTCTPEAEKHGFDPGSVRRVTKIGRLLRNTKLDELPQLWNVLAGDMSLVGPRPEVQRWVEVYPERWAIVHKVRPGITDPASIEFRNEEEMLAGNSNPEEAYRHQVLPKKLDLYENYVRTQSFIGDFSLILKTIFVLVKKSANK